MPRQRKIDSFYIVVTDRDKGIFNVLGPMNDDRPINKKVCLAQDRGRKVNCHTAGHTDHNLIVASTKSQFGLEYTDTPIIDPMLD
jgi:hypothetical protein